MTSLTSANQRLETLSRGFRKRYLAYAELTEQVQAWAQAFPDVVRVSSLAKTPEGRDLWLLTIGPEPERARPSVWIDGNMHASELCGSSVALAIAEDAIRLHTGELDELHGLQAPVLEPLREVLWYVLPRMSPDGAEAVLTTGRYVRSIPRDERPHRNQPRWRCGDINGDGEALVMRVRDEGGEFVESPEIAGLMLPRRIEDPPPYYKIYPEGEIDNFDGSTVPTPTFLSDTQTDLNRNFPYSWAPEHQQAGAGAFPTSEVESRAVVEFVSEHPTLFAWLNLHTFGGVFIRPLGNQPDNKMNRSDLALFRQIADWSLEFTGYPTVSGFEEFTYEPDTPLHGDLVDFAYHQRGCIAYVCELWDLFEQAGLPKKKRFVDRYTELSRSDLIAIARWDLDHNEGRVVRPWAEFDHPQLGAVEVGGLDPRFGLWNPPLDRLEEVCRGQAAAFVRVAATAPRVRLAPARVEALGGDSFRIEVVVENVGYLPTYVLESARELEWNEPLAAEARSLGNGCAIAAPALQAVGHLDGWGRGLYDGSGALYYSRSRGNTGQKMLTWVVRGRGIVELRAGSCRTGWISQQVEIQ